jgi:hypothetical protein
MADDSATAGRRQEIMAFEYLAAAPPGIWGN